MPAFNRKTSLYVTKRDGTHEKLSLDDIQERIEVLCDGLQVQADEEPNDEKEKSKKAKETYGIEPVNLSRFYLSITLFLV